MYSHRHTFFCPVEEATTRQSKAHKNCQATVKQNGVVQGWKPKLGIPVSQPLGPSRDVSGVEMCLTIVNE